MVTNNYSLTALRNYLQMNVSSHFPYYYVGDQSNNGLCRSFLGDVTNTYLSTNKSLVSGPSKLHVSQIPSAVPDNFPNHFVENSVSGTPQPIIDTEPQKERKPERVPTPSPSVPSESIRHSERSRSKRKPRTVFSRIQLARMKEAFTSKPYLTTDERKSLAVELKVTPEQVKVWFQNHRSKLKRQGRLICATSCVEHLQHYSAASHQSGSHVNQLGNYALAPHSLNTAFVPPPGTFIPPLAYGHDQSFDYFNASLYQVNDCYGTGLSAFYPSATTPQSSLVDSTFNGCLHPSTRMPTGYINPVYIGSHNSNVPINGSTRPNASAFSAMHNNSYSKQQFHDSK